MRTIQKLSLLYGFEYNTDEEIAELWIAAASAAGVDISRELLEKEVVNKFVPRVIQRIAARASAEVVEKWAGRMIPLASSAIGAGLNYWFVRAWGERAKAHFRQRHLQACALQRKHAAWRQCCRLARQSASDCLPTAAEFSSAANLGRRPTRVMLLR